MIEYEFLQMNDLYNLLHMRSYCVKKRLQNVYPVVNDMKRLKVEGLCLNANALNVA